MTSGVYLITTPNQARYVGQSANIERRWANHKNELLRNRHRNPRLQNIANKYGIASFKFEILIICDKSNLGMYEILAERAMSPELNVGTCGDSPMLGKKFTGEHRQRLSVALKGRKIFPESIAKMRETIRANGPSDAQLREYASRKGKPVSESSLKALANGRLGRKCSAKQLAVLSSNRHVKYIKAVRCVQTGEIFENARSAEKYLGKSNSNVLSACQGKLKSAYGFTWEFV